MQDASVALKTMIETMIEQKNADIHFLNKKLEEILLGCLYHQLTLIS